MGRPAVDNLVSSHPGCLYSGRLICYELSNGFSEMVHRMKQFFRSRWTKGLVFLALAGLGLVYAYHHQVWECAVSWWCVLSNKYQVKALILSFGPYSPLAYILLQVLQVIVAPIPGGAIEFMGGFLFGAKVGFWYSMVGLIIGSYLAFLLARIFERWVVEKFVSPETIKKFDYLIGHEGVILSFLLFLIPGFPKDALCYVLGLTPMRTGIFLAISTIGRIPGTLMACLQGGKAFDNEYKAMLILLGLSTLVILVFYLYHEQIHRFLKRLAGTENE
jgi:uncharacterized membrane protein YdjX (TVP38/TMEM64 family)